jgi:hypothetical protein
MINATEDTVTVFWVKGSEVSKLVLTANSLTADTVQIERDRFMMWDRIVGLDWWPTRADAPQGLVIRRELESFASDYLKYTWNHILGESVVYGMDMEKLFGPYPGHDADPCHNCTPEDQFASIAHYEYYYYQNSLSNTFESWSKSGFLVSDSSRTEIARSSTTSHVFEIQCGAITADFITEPSGLQVRDEFILYGRTHELLGDLNGQHIACYSYDDAAVTSNWLTPGGAFEYLHYFDELALLCGRNSSGDSAMFIDVRNGDLNARQPVQLPHSLEHFQFLELGQPPRLHVMGVYGDTLYVYALDVAVGVDGDSPALPTSFVLHPNHPNPFNAGTVISFDLTQRSDVTLSIYNLLGQEVAQMVDGELPVGAHSYHWNGENSGGEELATGIYFAVLKTGDQIGTQKMMLLK